MRIHLPETVQTRRLLSIEDNADTCDMLKAIFEPHGYLILIAQSAGEAFRILRNSLIDVFVIDVMLPDGSGIDLCRKLRANNRNTPILFFSSNDQCRLEALEAGANRFVDKSRSEDLEATVLALVAKAESNSMCAKLAEKDAIRAELEAALQNLKPRALAARARADELRLKAKAYRAFIEAGGTTAHFKRLWPEAMREVLV